MEEFKAALDLSEKNRKCGEAEIQNLAERSNLLHMQNTGLVQSKRKARVYEHMRHIICPIWWAWISNMAHMVCDISVSDICYISLSRDLFIF